MKFFLCKMDYFMELLFGVKMRNCTGKGWNKKREKWQQCAKVQLSVAISGNFQVTSGNFR